MQRSVRKGRRIVVNAVWSATKTRQYHPESRTRMLFRRGAIRGHSTVAHPIARDSSNQSRPPGIQCAGVGSRRVSATMHKCVTCGRAFACHFTLQRHASRCRPKPFTCDVCHSSFGRKDNLDRHKRTVQCGMTTATGTRTRRRIVASLNEDPVFAPPVEHAANDELSSAIRDAVRENWGSVRTHVAQ